MKANHVIQLSIFAQNGGAFIPAGVSPLQEWSRFQIALQNQAGVARPLGKDKCSKERLVLHLEQSLRQA
jgi:hypothetical protein